MPGSSWRQPFFTNATEHQDAYAYNGTVGRHMLDGGCNAFNRLYDDNTWLMSGEAFERNLDTSTVK